MYDIHGNKLTEWGDEELREPHGIAIYHGKVYVADARNRRCVVRFFNVFPNFFEC